MFDDYREFFFIEGNGFDNCGVVPADSFTRVEQFPATCKYDGKKEIFHLTKIQPNIFQFTISQMLMNLTTWIPSPTF